MRPYAWNTSDINSLAHYYSDKQVIGGFSTKNNIGYRGWAHVAMLYDPDTAQYLPVRTRGGINETPWHQNTIAYGSPTRDKYEAITSLYILVERDTYHYDSAQVIDCIAGLMVHVPH